MYTRNNNNNNNPSDYYSSSSAPPINEDDELNDNNNTTNTNTIYNNNNNNLNNNNNMDNSNNNNNENNNFRSSSPTFSSISCATSITTNTVNPELLECQICLEIVTDNRECKKCGAIYCKECLAAWFKNNNKNCPHCNAQPVFLEKDFSLNQFVQRLVDNLDVTCPNQMNGCDLKIVKRGNLKEHLEKFCNGRIINCENEKFGCKWKGCIKDYKYHQENDCLFCKVEIKNCLQKLQEKIEALTLENQELKERLKRSTFNNIVTTTTTSGGINGGGIVGGNNGVVVNVENVGVVDPYGNASAPQVLLNNNNNNLYNNNNNNNQQLNNSQLLNNLMNNSFVNGVSSNSSSGSSGVNSPILNTSVLSPTGINNGINIMNNNTSSGINNMQQSFLSGFVNNTFLRKKYKVIGTLQWTRYNGMYFNNNQNYGYNSGIGGSSGLQSPFEFVFEVDQDGNIVNTLSFSNNNNNYYSDHQMNSSINSNNNSLMYTSSLMQQNQQKRITGTLKGNTLNFVEISTMDGKETNYWGNITPPSNKIYLTFQSMGYYNNSGYIDGYFYSL